MNHQTLPKPYLTYTGEHVQFLQSFRYIGIDVPPTNKWSICFEFRLQIGWKSYNTLKGQCNQSDTHGWKVKQRYVMPWQLKSCFMRNAAGKLLLWLNMLNKSDMRIVNFWFSPKQPSIFVLLMIYNTKVYLLLGKKKKKG